MHKEAIFQTVFGSSWQILPPVMKLHYANRAYSEDCIQARGMMSVEMSPLMRFLRPLLRLTRTLVPYEGQNIPTTVDFKSSPDNDSFTLDRVFFLEKHGAYRFRSSLFPLGGDELLEIMPSGIAWRAKYSYQNHKVLIEHRGYAFRMLGFNIPLPLTLLFGKGYAEEQATGEHSFRMKMTITHPVFGQLYAYSGEFDIAQGLS